MNRENKHFSTAAYRLLLEYNYPGNVRELGNIIEYAVALSPEDDKILDMDLPLYILEMKPAFSITDAIADGHIQIPVGFSLKEVEKESDFSNS